MKAVAKSRKINLGGDGTDEISSMFNNILNGEKVPLDIVWPRYLAMSETITSIFDNLQLLHDCSLFQRLKDAKASLAQYLKWARAEHARFFSMDLHEYTSDFSLVEEEIHTQFDKIYREMKESQFVRQIIKSLEQLIVYRHDFMPRDNNVSMKERLGFIIRMPTADWHPFPFTFDLKGCIMMQGIGQNTYSFIVAFLERYYVAAKALWDRTQEPDIDVDRFTEIISESVEKLKTLPELHRCTTAFAKIKSSLGMFKDNFSNYYHNFIDTKDSTTIMHEFIMDVSNSTDTNPKLTMEFRTIINYYRKMAEQQKNMDPNAKKLFGTIDEAFKRSEQDVDGDTIRKAARDDAIANNKARLGTTHGRRRKQDDDAASAAAAAAAAAAGPEEDIDVVMERINGGEVKPSKPRGKK